MTKLKRLICLLLICILSFSLAVPVYAEMEQRMMIYTITYNTNGATGTIGGTGTIRSQSKPDGITVYLASTVPTKNNYIFCGWSETQNSQIADYHPNDAYTANRNVTLYAVWKPFSYADGSIYNSTFYYPPNGGTSGAATWSSEQCDGFARLVYYTVNNYYIPKVSILEESFTPVTLTSSNLYSFLESVGAGAYLRGNYVGGSSSDKHSLYVVTYTNSTVTILDANWSSANTVNYRTLTHAEFLNRMSKVTCYFSHR